MIPGAGHSAYFDQLAATVEEIGRLSALRTPVVVVTRSIPHSGTPRLAQSQRGCPGSPWSLDQYQWLGVETG